ncbi:hypothetical protein M3Y97_00296900 [Aphelenchoides bicaudatus]|nr:hypothetical protein M3Y97_00296900 [Aphelenchoides bicaudatus]
MMLRVAIPFLLICIFALSVNGYENVQWIRQNETVCGICPLDHQCYRPLKYEAGPFVCHPDKLNINLPIVKSVEQYCSTLNTQWLMLSYVSGICFIFTLVNILLVVVIVRCRICR